MTNPEITSTFNSAASTALPRHLAMEGSTNFRDLGGYAGLDGRTMRWRQLFRSDHLAALSAADLQQLQHLQVTQSVDFRGAQERSHDAYAWPQLRQHVLGIEPTLVQRAVALMLQGERLTTEQTVVLMQDTYRSFVVEGAGQFAAFLQLLAQQPPEQALVFHCTAGKDRTGWAAALLLLALGVSQDVVMEDYLLTNELYRRPAALAGRMTQQVPQEVLEVLWRVQAPFLNSALQLVQEQYGSMDRYLQQVLGVDLMMRDRLASRFLEG